MIRRSTLGALAASLALVSSLVVGAEPASADPPPVVTSHWDSTVVHPGGTVSLTTTYTNPEEADVLFVYLTINTGYDMITDGTQFSYVGCTGQASDCPMHPNVPIAPGASRTMTTTWRIDDDSPCGGSINLGFFYYLYWETATGNDGGIASAPTVTVLC
jgi:hypothetical protein